MLTTDHGHTPTWSPRGHSPRSSPSKRTPASTWVIDVDGGSDRPPWRELHLYPACGPRQAEVAHAAWKADTREDRVGLAGDESGPGEPSPHMEPTA